VATTPEPAATTPEPVATTPEPAATTPEPAARAARPDVDRVWRECAPHVVAALVRRYGDFDAAEDATQEALLAATRQWPQQGVPDEPRAWLVRVGSRRLIDQWRSDVARTAREERAWRLDVRPDGADGVDGGHGLHGGHGEPAGRDRDESLTLLLLCCHPALTPASQVALTLRAVGGLSTAQIARAFLVPESTMAQRISRAKTRLRAQGARFAPPTAAELPARVGSVLRVLYLVFTEGHTSSGGDRLVDVELTAEAIRLARLLHGHLPSDAEVAGLLALMLLTDARRAARSGPDGELVPLAEQDRARWDAAAIAEGVALVERALPVGPVGPHQLQAAIAALHAEAVSAAQTDWAQIELLYRMLAGVEPGPVVTLNHAVAVAHVQGPVAALDLLRPLDDDDRMRRHHRLHAVRAHLLAMAGREDEARAAFSLAAGLATSTPEQRYLRARAAGG
jgi:RNA polymerase sigma factor (sigma-70 family)